MSQFIYLFISAKFEEPIKGKSKLFPTHFQVDKVQNMLDPVLYNCLALSRHRNDDLRITCVILYIWQVRISDYLLFCFDHSISTNDVIL